MTSTSPKGTLGSVAYSLAVALYQLNPDRNLKLWNIVSSDIYVICRCCSRKGRAGSAYPCGAPEFTSGFSGVRVAWSLVWYLCFVDRCLSFSTFSVVFSSSIYGFWLPLWYLQTLLWSRLSTWQSTNRTQCVTQCMQCFPWTLRVVNTLTEFIL
jgi:hypothetical protein